MKRLEKHPTSSQPKGEAMNIQFFGAARTVTGSCHMIEANGVRFSVDCGMHQGNHEIEKRNSQTGPYRPKEIDFILVSHAHIDHTGLLPRMRKEGFNGVIYATPPTIDLLDILLQDSAHIQEMETEWENRKRYRQHKKPIAPLYSQDDALETMRLVKPVEYGVPFQPAPGITVTYRDAGHILGSAFLEIKVQEDGKSTTLLFSGDLGRPNALLVSDPEVIQNTDYLFLESTYGNRNHKDEGASRDELAEAIAYSYARGEKVVIPAFAVERTQEIIYSLFLLHKEGRLPEDMPVYLDSPLAIKATKIFRNCRRFLDEETQELLRAGEDPLDLPNLRLTPGVEESKAINAAGSQSAVIISASGMCNAGRIKHHLRHNLWREGASIVFVGFQAQGSPGRRIVDGASKIRLFGEDISINAKIFTIGGFSAHAGQREIMDWISPICNTKLEVFLVHGEESAMETLAGLIRESCGFKTYMPSYLEQCELMPGGEIKSMAAPEEALPRVDWANVLAGGDKTLTQLKLRLGEVKALPWTDQADFRERFEEIHEELKNLVAELDKP